MSDRVFGVRVLVAVRSRSARCGSVCVQSGPRGVSGVSICAACGASLGSACCCESRVSCDLRACVAFSRRVVCVVYTPIESILS